MAPIPINQSATIGTSLSPIGAALALNGRGRDVSVEIQNTGAAALTALKIQRQFFDGGDWTDWLANGDFDTATSKCSASGGTSGNKVYFLAAGASGWIDFDPGAVIAVRFLASCASSTMVNIVGGARLERD